MTEIDPQKFGELKGRVRALEDKHKEIKDAIKDGVQEMKKIVEDHMKEEILSNTEQNNRIAELARFIGELENAKKIIIFIFTHWKAIAFIGLSILVLVLGFILPAIRELVLNLTNGKLDFTFLTYYTGDGSIINF